MKLIKVIVAPGAFVFWDFLPRKNPKKADNPYGEWIWVGREVFNG